MALVLADRVQETTTTSGTGTLSLGGAVSGYRTFVSGVGSGNTTYYAIYDQTAQVWEVGYGTVTSGSPATLTRTTVFSNSSGTTSPINLAGNAASVFAVYTASKNVSLDASGNVTALGNVTSASWLASVIGVAYGGTGVTTSSGANSVVLRDTNQNISANNFLNAYNQITAAAGTTVLTTASAYWQKVTGSTTQTIQLPDATTCVLGQTFIVDNDSSGTVTIVDNASATVDTVPSGALSIVFAESISTSAGSWGKYAWIPGSYDFSTTTANFGGATITNGTWNGNTVGTGYGGTGLTSFTSGGAVYANSGSTLTSGTLPVTAGGTGQTTFSSGYIPYGNSTAALQSSASLQFNGTYLVVGGTSPLGGATNPITAFSSSANNYVQTYVYNATGGTSSSADFVAYANNSTDAHGWADMGFTSSVYSDSSYSVTGPNEAYVFGSAPANASATGNLVYATDSTGTANSHQWYIGGFNKAKNAWSMQLTTTGLQLANALSTSYGGTGLTTVGTNGQVLTSNGTALSWVTPTTGVTSLAATSPVAVSGSTGSVTVSLSSGYGDTQNPYASKTANYFLAAPAGSAGTPGFRAIVAGDIPTLNQNTSGTAAGLSSTLVVSSGGTGATTLTGVLKGNGTSAFTAAVAGTDYVAPGGALGTPSSGTLTNCTFPTLNQNTTGSAGSVANALTIGTGLKLSSGTTYNGSAAVTLNAPGTTINSQTGAYVAVAGDAGKTISITTGGVTINNSVFSAGDIVTIYNNSGSSQTITQGTGVTLQWAGQASSTTGNRTLGLYGIATIVFLSASSAVINGAGLT